MPLTAVADAHDWLTRHQTEVGLVGDLLTIATGAVAIYLAVRAIPRVNRAVAQTRLAVVRWRGLRAAFAGRPKGVLTPSFAAHLRRSRLLFQGVEVTPAWELDWLSRHMGICEAVTFASDVPAALRLELSLGYRAIGARCTTRGLLGVSQPVFETESVLCRQVYLLLVECANSVPEGLGEEMISMPDDGWMAMGDGGTTVRLPTAGVGTAPGEQLLKVSWFRERLVVQGASALKSVAEQDESELRTIEVPVPDHLQDRFESRLLSSPHSYDGILPRLLSWRRERDKGNGASILHLSVGETSYFAHEAVSNPVERRATQTPAQSCLTLSLLVVTSDDRLVTVERRSGDAWYPNGWSPTVNGNLDMPLPTRKDSDGDPSGLPDFAAALCREAAEEIGLTVSGSQIAIDGLGQIDSPAEVGTYVLVASVFVHETFEELAAGARYADRVMGRWELQGRARGLRRPSSPEESTQLLRWLWRSSQATPHLVTSLTLFLLNSGLVPPAEWGSWRDGPDPEPPVFEELHLHR